MSQASFTCFVIGGDTLLTECAEVLLSRGHHISGVITAAPRVRAWAQQKGLRTIDADGDYAAALRDEAFDYLFAITHLAILPDEVLALPARATINFHDGPLPRYAGLNTPAWALLNREESYGISWHLVTPGVDEGDLLQQRHFDLSADETSLSLNTRCFAAGLDSFTELVGQLEAGNEVRTPQDLSERTVFMRADRPEAGAFVDWNASADQIAGLGRALDFGPYPNPLAAPKVRLAGATYMVSGLEEADAERGGKPGEILDVTPHGVAVATGEGALRIGRFTDLYGTERSPRDLEAKGGLENGARFDVLSEHERAELEDRVKRTAPAERFWLRRLEQLEPVQLPNARDEAGSGHPAPESFSMPGSLSELIGQRGPAVVIAALTAWLSRTSGKSSFSIGHRALARNNALGRWSDVFADTVPMRAKIEGKAGFTALVGAVEEELSRVEKRQTFLRDLIGRHPELSARAELHGGLCPVAVAIGPVETAKLAEGSQLTFAISEDARSVRPIFDGSATTAESRQRLLEQLGIFFDNLGQDANAPLGQVSLLSQEERELVLEKWNKTGKEHDRTSCLHELFEAQVAATPELPAVVFEGHVLTYAQLNQRANQLARHLRTLGVGPDTLVGVYVERSLELMIAIYAVHKAGGAYVPLDPAFPEDRIAYMIEDAKAPVVIANAHLAPRLAGTESKVVRVDADRASFAKYDTSNLSDTRVTSSNLAYVIYTSGSTGKPKGVMVEHRNVHNFFVGMDERIPTETLNGQQPCWLAVTSLSFDISVLELFWTLTRGFRVVVYKDRAKGGRTELPAHVAARPMGFGLFMWGNDDGPGKKKYELLLEGAKYLDKNGFNSVWTPERHFHAFGGPYPNPAVTGAALAVSTENMSIRSGSCVSPLHHPIRIAEEWAVVDNLSGGRVGLSFAAGWQPNDFVIRPEAYGTKEQPKNKQVMLEQIDIVRRLWRGEKVAFPNPFGDMVDIQTLPRPVQPELPFWVTTAGNPKTYEEAGRSGANVLTHLLGQSFEEVAGKIAIYRKAREEAGFDPKTGTVTLMLHTLLADSRQKARELAHQPLKDYLGSSVALVKGFAWTFPAFKRPEGEKASPMDIDLGALSEEELDAILEFAFDRYFETSGLFGTVDEALDIVDKAKSIDVDEIACLLDFGAETAQIFDSLPLVAEVAQRANAKVGTLAPTGLARDLTLAGQIRDNGVTHMQCTPSMARMMLLDERTKFAMGMLEHMMVGGEAFPSDLAAELKFLVRGTVTNMYGPTETTIWSSTHRLDDRVGHIPIGKPIANTALYVLDDNRQPVSVGTPGELWIGGEGVVRGYFERPRLTEERFVRDPFSHVAEARMYRTGDLVRWRADGVLEFIGRVDHQVKIRGYRIELGEIEARLSEQPGVRECVVVVREDSPGDQRLVGYMVPMAGVPKPEETSLRSALRRKLPEYMVPAAFVFLDAMPLTPNGKIDRKALPNPDTIRRVEAAKVEVKEPEGDVERKIADVWKKTLGKDSVGVDDNFFDIGGHSLLVVRMHRELKSVFDQPIDLTDLYRFPTIRTFTEHLSGDEAGGAAQAGSDRAARRLERRGRRRR